jgi:hypothetical protein
LGYLLFDESIALDAFKVIGIMFLFLFVEELFDLLEGFLECNCNYPFGGGQFRQGLLDLRHFFQLHFHFIFVIGDIYNTERKSISTEMRTNDNVGKYKITSDFGRLLLGLFDFVSCLI